MATQVKGYGKISITAITKVGTLMVNPTCDKPLNVIYDPDTNSYTPTWSSGTPLNIVPIVYFDGVATTDFTVVYKRQFGTETIGTVVSGSNGETVTNKNLVVSSNRLAGASSKLLTYIIEVSYYDSKTKTTLNNTSRLTFSLINNPSTVKYISLTGENVFLYNSSQVLISESSIVLTAHLTNVTMNRWTYLKDGTYIDFPGATHTSNTLTINVASAPMNTNEAITVKATAKGVDNSTVEDTMTIVKIRDGAPGGSSVAVVLTNTSHILACDSNNNPLTSSFTGAETTVQIYEGSELVTSHFDIAVAATPSANIGWSNEAGTTTYKVTSFTGTAEAVGYLTFTCTGKTGSAFVGKTLVSKFNLTKVKAGVDGANAETYELSSSVNIMNRNIANALNPTKVVFGMTKRVGGETPTPFGCLFKIYESPNFVADISDASFVQKFPADASKTTMSSKQWLATDILTTTKTIKVECYKTDYVVGDLIDTQLVVINTDGATGSTGAAGKDAFSVVLGNEAEIISCSNGGTVLADTVVTIPFRGYKGTTRTATTATVDDNSLPGPTGNRDIYNISTTASTASADGVVSVTFRSGRTLGGAAVMNGRFTINLTVSGATAMPVYFSWTKSNKAKDGVDAVTFQIYTNTGDTIINGSNNVILDTMLQDGSVVTNATSYTWNQWVSTGGSGGSYNPLTPPVATKTLTVTPAMVDSVAFFSCVAVYTVDGSAKNFTAYFTVYDKSDPFQVQPYSTLGESLVNPGFQAGAIFTKVYRSGVEEDPLLSHEFGTTYPASPSVGQYFYMITPTAGGTRGTVKLMKRAASTWEDVTATSNVGYTYNYYIIDIDDVLVDLGTPWAVGKAIYFDTDDTNPTLNLIAEVIH